MRGPVRNLAKDLLKSNSCLQNSGNHREPSKNLGSVTVGPQARLGTGRGLGNKVNWDRDRQSQEGRWNKFKISWESCNLTLE